MICGRSIGSGPACYLAAKYNPLCLILISPIKSVVSIAKNIVGSLANLLMEERFDNMKIVNKVKCPVAIVHGIDDKLVPIKDSQSLLVEGFTNTKAHLFQRQGMTHNQYFYVSDVVRPLKYFFKCHHIYFNYKESIKLKS